MSEVPRSRPFLSDYRCQLRIADEKGLPDLEARIHFIGRETAMPGDELAVLVTFLDRELARPRCGVGARFELREGMTVTADGAISAMAER